MTNEQILERWARDWATTPANPEAAEIELDCEAFRAGAAALRRQDAADALIAEYRRMMELFEPCELDARVIADAEAAYDASVTQGKAPPRPDHGSGRGQVA